MSDVKIFDMTSETISSHALCTLKNKKHEGYIQKSEWITEQMNIGLCVKILKSEKLGDVGMIEYIPGEYAWRSVEANGYMFIHCLFIAKKDVQKQGWGNKLIEACIEDAKKKKMKGVVTVTSTSAFLAEKDIFLKLGFELVDTAEPAYELIVLKFGKHKNPAFPEDLDKKIKKYNKGLVIFKSKQCPFIAKAIKEIEKTALDAGVNPKIIDVKNSKEAQALPVAYGCFGMLWNGQIVADHPISNGRFKNILKKIILPSMN